MGLLNTIKDLALLHPDSIAFRSPSKKITFEALWQQSDQVAKYILKQIIKADSPIIVYGHMEPEMLVSFLGSVKSGHAYIPIDTSIPIKRIKRISTNSQAELLINLSGGPLVLDDTPVRIISFDEMEAFQVEPGEVDPKNWVTEDENFYIIYTSGSTGNPKGVQISYNNLQSFVNWMLEDFPISGGFQFLNQAPFSFDLSVMALYPALTSGGSLFAITKDMIANPRLLFETLKESNTQVWISTPSFVQMCLMDPSFEEALLPDLTVFMFCGEILPRDIARQLKQRFPKAKVFNTYGPTEATVAVTSIEITEELHKYPNLPVGKTKKDTKVLIINEDGHEVPKGEKGEIIIVGPSVSIGYLGEQERNKNSFYSINGEMAYRTGDAGYVENELLFYKGRMDFQIKLHGYRIELEEIEIHIAKTKYVKRAVVVPIYKNDNIEYLAVAIVPEEHEFKKEYHLTSAIKKELGTMLPAYMIPRKFVYYRELPMTSNGKIDREQIGEKVKL